jgi:hypothetical protein
MAVQGQAFREDEYFVRTAEGTAFPRNVGMSRLTCISWIKGVQPTAVCVVLCGLWAH